MNTSLGRSRRWWSLLMLIAVLSSAMLIPAQPAWATSIPVHGPVPQERTGVPAGTATNTVSYPETTIINYASGLVTFTKCPNSSCMWAADDGIRLTVTRPNGTQQVRDLISNTQDRPPEDVTSMFMVGANAVKVELIDLMGPERGLSYPMYLVTSSNVLPPGIPEVIQLPPNSNAPFSPYVLHSNDPVNTFTGSYMYVHTDVAIAGRGPAPRFIRSYDSANTLVGPMGPGWTHSYNVRLVRPDSSTNDIVLIGPQGRADRYVYNAGNYTPPQGVYSALVRNSNGTYTVTDKDLTVWSFDQTGQLSKITDRFGNYSTMTYDSNGRLTNVSDPAGRGSLTLSYNGSGRLTGVTDWANRTVSFGYDGSGRLTTVTDRESKSTTYAYDGTSSRIASITDARTNVVVTNTYDAQGRVATQKDTKGLVTGQQTDFAYVTNGDGSKTTTVTYPATSFEPSWRFVTVDNYDTQSRITGRVSKPTSSSADWITELFGYDAVGNRTSVADGRGNSTLFCYDVDYAGATISGSRGNLTRQIAPSPSAGASRPVTLFKYDTKDNLVQTVPPKGVSSSSTTSCSTNLSGGLNLGYATNFTYDGTQTKLVSSERKFTDPDTGQKTATTKYEYADTFNPGLVTKVIPPRGNTSGTPDYTYATSFAYVQSGAKAGMLQSTTTPAGTTTYDYDTVGRRTSMVDPNGNVSGANPADHTWQYVYDNEDRVRFSKAPSPVSGGAQLVTEQRYDAVGNNTAAIDANGQVTRFIYDERDNLKEVDQSPNIWTDPAVEPTGKIVTEYQYDHLGNLSRTTRAKGDSANERVTDYAYDGMARLKKETQYPGWPATTPTLVTSFAYDKTSNQTSKVDPLGATTTYGFDALNRLTGITYNSTSTPNVSYTYDANGNRATMVDGTGTTTYAYDEWDRVTSVVSPGPKTVGYRYDIASNRTKLIYPDATAVTYGFDKADRMSSLVDWSNRTTSYQYNPDSTLKHTDHLNGTSADYSYDNATRLTQVWNKFGANTITRHTYTMDAVGNRTRSNEVFTSYWPAPITSDRLGTLDYTYDRLYRLKQESRTVPWPQSSEIFAYTYDPVGNRLSKSRTAAPFPAQVTNYTYDRADRFTTVTGDEAETIATNANGNITQRSTVASNLRLGYDQENRLIMYDVWKYAYNGDGLRTRKEQTGWAWSTRRDFVFDMNRDLPVILQEFAPNNATHKFVWGVGLLYTVDNNDLEAVYHLDGLGSVVAMTQDNIAPDMRVTMFQPYDAFGNKEWSNANYDQPFYFTGEQLDSESNYQYLRARMYDPRLGRFLSRDPVAGSTRNPLSLNRYSYVENNPVNAVDPSGKVVWILGAAAIGGVGSGIANAMMSEDTSAMGRAKAFGVGFAAGFVSTGVAVIAVAVSGGLALTGGAAIAANLAGNVGGAVAGTFIQNRLEGKSAGEGMGASIATNLIFGTVASKYLREIGRPVSRYSNALWFPRGWTATNSQIRYMREFVANYAGGVTQGIWESLSSMHFGSK